MGHRDRRLDGGCGMDKPTGLRQDHIAAIAFASTVLRRGACSLSRNDLEQAYVVAAVRRRSDILKPLRVLIQFRELRDFYCRVVDETPPQGDADVDAGP